MLITYAVFLFVEFLVLMAGIVASVRLLFDIQTGLFDADVIPELSLYETDSWVRYKWDTLQSKYDCFAYVHKFFTKTLMDPDHYCLLVLKIQNKKTHALFTTTSCPSCPVSTGF